MDINQYKYIKKLRDSSPFTASLPLDVYVEQIRRRVAIVTGKPIEQVTDELVYKMIQ